jgi:hypothetical protein
MRGVCGQKQETDIVVAMIGSEYLAGMHGKRAYGPWFGTGKEREDRGAIDELT